MKKDKVHGKISKPTAQGFILKEALEAFASGRFNRKVEVCEFLVEKEFWTAQRPVRYIDKLTEIMKDPFYAGYIEYLDWGVELRKGHHEGIISFETFQKIQERLKPSKSQKTIRSDLSEVFPLRGLLVCAECGCHLTAAVANPNTKPYSYYSCQKHGCSLYGKMARKKDVEDGFNQIMEESRLKAEVGLLVEAEFEKVWEDEVKRMEVEEKENAVDIKKLEDEIEKLAKAIATTESEVARRQFEKQIEKVDEKLQALRERILVSESDLKVPYRNALEKAVGLVESPYETWVSMDLLEQHELFFFLFEEKLSYDRNEGYRNAKNVSVAMLFEEFAVTNSQDVEMGGVEPPSELGCDCESTVCS